MKKGRGGTKETHSHISRAGRSGASRIDSGTQTGSSSEAEGGESSLAESGRVVTRSVAKSSLSRGESKVLGSDVEDLDTDSRVQSCSLDPNAGHHLDDLEDWWSGGAHLRTPSSRKAPKKGRRKAKRAIHYPETIMEEDTTAQVGAPSVDGEALAGGTGNAAPSPPPQNPLPPPDNVVHGGKDDVIWTDSFTGIIQKHLMDFGTSEKPPRIPMCRLVGMEMVRTLQVSTPAISNLKVKFRTHGYVEAMSIFYVQPTDENGATMFVTDAIRATWDKMWIGVNTQFEAECRRSPHFSFLADKMFSVFDGNHRLFAWNQVAKENPDELLYHPRIACQIFKGNKDSYVEIETAMHAINGLTECVVESTWILDADRIARVLKHPMESYEHIIHSQFYGKWLKERNAIRKHFWYTEYLTQNAIAYVLSSITIRAGEDKIQKQMALSTLAANPWSKKMEQDERQKMTEEALKVWKNKVSKIVSMLNPEYGDFMAVCAEMHAMCEKMKNVEGKVSVACGLDRARIFSGQEMDAKLRCDLLRAHFTPSLRKDWFHPKAFSEEDTRNWITRHRVWHTVETTSDTMLRGVIEQTYSKKPLNDRSAEEIVQDELFQDKTLEAFGYYQVAVKKRYFNVIWILKDGAGIEHDDMVKRAKRFVFRFFLYKEQTTPQYFRYYPQVFRSWMETTVDSDGNEGYGEYSMYPVNLPKAPRPPTDWEHTHCPWYLECDNYSVAFDDTEKANFRIVTDEHVPETYFVETKLGPDENEDSLAILIESLPVDVAIKERRPKSQKAKSEAEGAKAKSEDDPTEVSSERVSAKKSRRRKREQSEGEPLSPVLEEKEVPDKGSIAKKKKQKAVIDLTSDKTVAVHDVDLPVTVAQDNNKAGDGLERDYSLKIGATRHLFVCYSLAPTWIDIKSLKRPKWFKRVQEWSKVAVSGKQVPNPVLINNKPAPHGCHMGFLNMPSGLSVEISNPNVPEWNMVYGDAAADFFCVMNLVLHDQGFVAVLNSGLFQDMINIHRAALAVKFKHVRKLSVFFKHPLWDAARKVEVSTFSLDIFCRHSNISDLPVDFSYKAVHSMLDGLHADFLVNDVGSHRNQPILNGNLTPGFLQAVIELLSKPSDVSFFFNCGDGYCFLAGDFSARFVVGFEDRDVLKVNVPVDLEAVLRRCNRPASASTNANEITMDPNEDPFEMNVIVPEKVINLEDLVDSDTEAQVKSSSESSLANDSWSSWDGVHRQTLREFVARTAFQTPPKPFLLPSYAESEAQRSLDSRFVREKKSRKKLRLPCPLVDDMAEDEGSTPESDSE